MRNINVTAINRPIKIAYITPFEDTVDNHLIIDAIFCESYMRWGGTRTLIIPSDINKFHYPELAEWLQFFDPDIIYSFIDISEEFIKKIDLLCRPLWFLKHSSIRKAQTYNDFLPLWESLISIKPISSISTFFSPMSTLSDLLNTPEPNKLIVTQHRSYSINRFVSDNFGTRYSSTYNTVPIAGLFETICLSTKDTKKCKGESTIDTDSLSEILLKVTSHEAITISNLATIHSENIPKIHSMDWSQSLNIFIGSSCLDRINFWNARNLSTSWSKYPSAIIANIEMFDDSHFVTALGKYLNKNNNFTLNSGQPHVSIRSMSIALDKLKKIRDMMQKFTYNFVILEKQPNKPALPQKDDIRNSTSQFYKDKTFFKLTDQNNQVSANAPEHLIFTPHKYYHLTSGEWAIYLSIEKHNKLSHIANVDEIWKFPHSHNAGASFTTNFNKITNNNLLSLIPKKPNKSPFDKVIRDEYWYNLSLPEDEAFFRTIIANETKLTHRDCRSFIKNNCFMRLKVSDKGKYLRGTISMFNNLNEAYKYLTNKFWRDVIRKFYSTEHKNQNDTYIEKTIVINTSKAFSIDELYAIWPNTAAIKKQLAEEAQIKPKQIEIYRKSNFYDCLDYLIQRNIFFQIHQWKCTYCGYVNVHSIDELKSKNSCKICNSVYLTPVDLEWKYKLNEFVGKSLCEHNGLTTLWALGLLQENDHMHNFMYLPEVDLYFDYETDNKLEIDSLCVIEGKLWIIEAKRSASSFTSYQTNIDKFIKIIELIKPDVACLAFERYSENETDTPSIKENLRLAISKIQNVSTPNLKVEIFVASDFSSYSNYDVNLGDYGHRTMKILTHE